MAKKPSHRLNQSQLAGKLRQMKIYNNFELLKRFGKPGDVCVAFNKPDAGLVGIGQLHGTNVWGIYPNPKLGKDNLDAYYNKKFYGKRAVSFPEAKTWVWKELGKMIVPSPFGDYLTYSVLAKARRVVEGIDDDKRIEAKAPDHKST